jgi:hypothetical protein
LWLVSLSIAGYLGWYVYRFVQVRDALRRGVPPEEQVALLDSVPVPEPPKDDIIAYDAIRTVFHQMNWTGEVKDKGGPATTTEQPKAKLATPVSELLGVVLIQVDPQNAPANLAVVRYKDPKLQMTVKTWEDAVLRPEEKLPAPHENVQVKRIEVEGVTFAFTDDPERAEETLQPLPFPSDDFGIVMVGPEGPLVPPSKSSAIVRNENYPSFRPLETVVVRSNEYLIGTQTAARVEQDYSRILSQDVSYQPYRNPRTREIEGLRITYVRGDSVVAQHGISEGEVLKSINGHTVKSVSDAIAYVKQAADTTDTWVALFEKQGKEFTRTYKSPSE